VNAASTEIVFLLFDGVAPLDAVGPYEVLQHVPGASITIAAREPGPCRADGPGLALVAEAAYTDTAPDVLVVPGGVGTRTLVNDQGLLEWLREAHANTRYTTSVCTGALLLGAAGILDGVDATTHWAFRDALADLGATPVPERVVERGKVITAAGVSSGIDMGLTLAARLAGDDVARAIQLGIEYDPQPPFDSGSVEKADAQTVELVRTLLTA